MTTTDYNPMPPALVWILSIIGIIISLPFVLVAGWGLFPIIAILCWLGDNFSKEEQIAKGSRRRCSPSPVDM